MYSILAIVQTSRTGWSQWLSISLKLLIRVQRAADTADWVVHTADVTSVHVSYLEQRGNGVFWLLATKNIFNSLDHKLII